MRQRIGQLKMPGTGLIYTNKAAVIYLLLLLGWLPAQAANLENQTLRYSVQYRTQNAGELEIIISGEGDRIKTTVTSHLSAIAKIFIDDLTEETWFSIHGDGVRVERGHTLSHDMQTVKRGYFIDRQNNRIQYDDGESVAVESIAIFESAAFPLVLINSDIGAIEGQIIREISPKRVQRYIYLAPEQQTLPLHGKNHHTWKVTRHKSGDPSRTVTVWLDRKNRNTPLQIISTRKGKDTVMRLIDNP